MKKAFIKLVSDRNRDPYKAFKYAKNNMDSDELVNFDVFLLEIDSNDFEDDDLDFIKDDDYSNKYLVKSLYKDYYETIPVFYSYNEVTKQFEEVSHSDSEKLRDIEIFSSNLEDSEKQLIYFGFDDFIRIDSKLDNAFKKLNNNMDNHIKNFQQFESKENEEDQMLIDKEIKEFFSNNLYKSFKIILDAIDGDRLQQDFWFEVDGYDILPEVQTLYDNKGYEEMIKLVITETGGELKNHPFMHIVNVKRMMKKMDSGKAIKKINNM